jgi:hypothetical protein
MRVKRLAERGQHGEAGHQALVTSAPLDLQHVQANDIRVKMQKRLVVWLARTICVPTRLWRGGVCAKRALRSKGVFLSGLETQGTEPIQHAWKTAYIGRFRTRGFPVGAVLALHTALCVRFPPCVTPEFVARLCPLGRQARLKSERVETPLQVAMDHVQIRLTG